MSITKKVLAQNISQKLGLSQKDSLFFVNSFFKVLTDNRNTIININKFGILEPEKVNKIIPNFILVPLLAYDSKKNRLCYGKGFYDKYINKFQFVSHVYLTYLKTKLN